MSFTQLSKSKVENSSYRSYLLRLWHEPPDAHDWYGEVESIQSGQLVAIHSLDEALAVIRQAVENDPPPATPSRKAEAKTLDRPKGARSKH
jgi:hypothetical protein